MTFKPCSLLWHVHIVVQELLPAQYINFAIYLAIFVVNFAIYLAIFTSPLRRT